MIPELAHLALWLALAMGLALVAVPMLGVMTGREGALAAGRGLALALFVFVSLAMLGLFWAFLTDDFSVALVASHSNTLLPDIYKFTALWGNHEGSLLLWVWMLSLWTVAVALFSRSLPVAFTGRVLAVMGLVAVGFLLFSLLTSNPFERLLPLPPAEGRDLNPLLQDPGMVLHPPLLYLGYVGFSVAFAFAIAALWSGRLDLAWARWSRPWTTVAWLFLTLGIALGSWWAYYELGWGGWWFWDPVENASFMPWLTGTALIHSLAVTEKRGAFRSWTVLLAIFTFSLSLLGTFLVRSGVLTSVHSFAADPERGLFILGFLGLVVGGSLTLYALRAPAMGRLVRYDWLSREMALLVNNILLVVAALTVLLGTLFPLLADALELGKYSVGPPYFNTMFIPLMALVLAFAGLGGNLQWKSTRTRRLAPLWAAAGVSLACGLLLPWLGAGEFHWGAALAVLLGGWVIGCGLLDWRDKLRHARSWRQGIFRLGASYYGMQLGHLGLAVAAIGVGVVSAYGLERDVRLAPGMAVDVGGYHFEWLDSRQVRGPNYQAQEGRVQVSRGDRVITELRPQKRRYLAQSEQLMTEAAIHAGFWRDLYVAMGEPLEDGAWAVRVQVKPLVRWIWAGGLLMALGGTLSAADRRYRRLARRDRQRHAEPIATGARP